MILVSSKILIQISFPSLYNSISHFSPNINMITGFPYSTSYVDSPLNSGMSEIHMMPHRSLLVWAWMIFIVWPLCLLYISNFKYSNCFSSCKSQSASFSLLQSCTVPSWKVFSHPSQLATTHSSFRVTSFSKEYLLPVIIWRQNQNSNSYFLYLFFQDTR